jgi:hypothetical protein
MARAQASTELIIIMGGFFLVLLVFLTVSLDYLFSIRSQRDFGDALSAVQTLASEADAVYAQGDGAEKIVTIRLPSSTVFSPNVTYIGRPLNNVSGTPNTIAISLNGTVVSATSQATVAGEFPSYSGTHNMLVASHGNYVSIGAYLASASPNSVFVSMQQDENQKRSTVMFHVNLSESSNESVRITLAWNWTNGNSSLQVSPVSFSSYGVSDVPVTLTFNSGSALGIYTSTLNVTAARYGADGSIGARQSFSVPLTLEVLSG